MESVEGGKEDSCDDSEMERVYVKNPFNKPNNLYPPTHFSTKTCEKALKLNKCKDALHKIIRSKTS